MSHFGGGLRSQGPVGLGAGDVGIPSNFLISSGCLGLSGLGKSVVHRDHKIGVKCCLKSAICTRTCILYSLNSRRSDNRKSMRKTN